MAFNNNNDKYDSLRVPLYPYTTKNGNRGLSGFQIKDGIKYTIKVFEPAPDKRGNKYEMIAYLTRDKDNKQKTRIPF